MVKLFAVDAILLLLVCMVVLLLGVVDSGLAVVNPPTQNCRPQNGLTATKCAIRKRKCAANGIRMKFVGRGCRIGRVIMRDGGCQCDGYCGYLCPQRCNKDKQCTWNTTTATCYSKLTGLVGGPIVDCSTSNATVPSFAPSISPITESPSCFHRDSLVKLESGNDIPLVDLKYGDKVAAFDPSSQQMIYSEVMGFSGFFPSRIGKGVRVDFNGGYLILSDEHVIYASIDGLGEPEFHMAKLLTSKSIIYGKNMSQKAVIGVSETTVRGWITPLTKSGTIIVNGVMASCHTKSHYVTRTLYTPLYWFLTMFPHTKGSSPDENALNEHWYSIGIRRSTLGKIVTEIVSQR